ESETIRRRTRRLLIRGGIHRASLDRVSALFETLPQGRQIRTRLLLRGDGGRVMQGIERKFKVVASTGRLKTRQRSLNGLIGRKMTYIGPGIVDYFLDLAHFERLPSTEQTQSL